MFDENTITSLRAYVYMLLDPRSLKPFYVGKGKGNRVFNHIECALNDESTASLKLDTIREICAVGKKPVYVIVRHGLTDSVALDVESALIDTLNYLQFHLSNISAGHNSIECGLMSADTIMAKYNAERLTRMAPDCVIININRSYKRTDQADAILEATKEIWRMKDPTNKIKTVLSEYHGLIVEVFEVERWYKKKRNFGSGSKSADKQYFGWGFDGHVAPEEVRKLYINRSIAHLKQRGAANVIRYSL